MTFTKPGLRSGTELFLLPPTYTLQENHDGIVLLWFTASVTLALQPFLLTESTSQTIWAGGTDGTCNMMGFFQQFAFSEIWYNGMLSFFFS